MPSVAITPSHFQFQHFSYYPILIEAGFEVRFIDPTLALHDPQVLIQALGDCQAVLASTEPYTREVMSNSNLRVISRAGVGFDSVDFAAATDLGIAVTRTPGVVHDSVVEQTLTFALSIYRDVIHRDRLVREGRWDRVCQPRLAGKTFGILGLGVIGTAVAQTMQRLGTRVIAYDPVHKSSDHAEIVTLDELFTQSDILSLHAPCTPETTNIINANTLATMKPGSILINTSRGGLVDEEALFEALRSGHLLGAGLDVLKQEPPRPDNPLLGLPQVIFAPHMGGMDLQSERDMAEHAAINIVDLFQGKVPERSMVNPEVARNWKW